MPVDQVGLVSERPSDGSLPPLEVTEPVAVRIRFASTTRADILPAIPGVTRVGGYTIEFTSPTMMEAYGLVRMAHKYIGW